MEQELNQLETHQAQSQKKSPKQDIVKKSGYLHFHILIHVIPPMITVAILFLNFASFYFEDIGAPRKNSILSAFQVVTKGHEILIQASLSAIVFYRIRYELTRDSIPFGFVTAGYQLLSVSYLFSQEFLEHFAPSAHAGQRHGCR